MTAASARLRRTLVNDYREVTKAAGALAGMAMAIWAAVVIGNMLGDSDPSIPTSVSPEVTSRTTVDTREPASSFLDGVFGRGETGTEQGARAGDQTQDPSTTGPRAGGPSDRSSGTTPGPVEVPPTTDLPGAELPPTDITTFIEDATAPLPGGGLVQETVEGVTGTLEGAGTTVGGVVGGLLGR